MKNCPVSFITKLFLLPIFLFTSLLAKSQIAPTYEWIKPDSSQMKDVCFHDNYLYSIGTKLTKWDTLGNKVWEKAEFYGHKIAIDSQHNILVLSSLPPAGGVFGGNVLSSAGGTDILVLKADSAGNFIWAHNYGNALNDSANEFCVDYNSDFYLNCMIGPSCGGNFIRKYSGSGQLIWSKSLVDSNACALRHIQYSAIDTTIVVSGLFKLSLTVDNQNIYTVPHNAFGHGTDLYILKLRTLNGSRIYLKNITQSNRTEYNNTEFYVNPNNGNIVYNYNRFTLGLSDAIAINEVDLSCNFGNNIDYVSALTNGFGLFSSNGNIKSYRSNYSPTLMRLKNATNNLLLEYDFGLNNNYPTGPFVFGNNSLYIPVGIFGVNQPHFAKIAVPPCLFNSSSYAFFVNICASQVPYIFNNQSLTTSGTFYDTLVNVVGCDSFVMLQLIVHPNPTPQLTFNGTHLITNGGYQNYSWYQNGNLVITNTDSTFLVPANDTYKIEVIDAYGCSGTSSNLTVSALHLSDNQNTKFDISVYPNPASESLTVQVTNKLTCNAKFILYDAIGNKIISENIDNKEKVTIQTDQMSTGEYYYVIICDGKRIEKGKLVFRK